MKRVPTVASLADSPKLMNLLQYCLGVPCFAVRSIFFDKTGHSNWLVPWHQDLSIAVKNCVEITGYGPWSIKDGIHHVQPPTGVLETMVTLRLHLDDCDASNGALRVIPGSHRLGRLSASEIAEVRRQSGEVTVSARVGDALVMRPLLLHASSEAVKSGHRRVVHLEFATSELPQGLEWEETPQVY